MSKPFYVTTTIPYVNAPPHIGHALELVQSDVIARYQRTRNHAVRFQTGTDENAFKNVLSARALGIPVQQLTDNNAAHFESLVSALHISTDTFVRTTSDAHRYAVTSFLARLNPDDVYRGGYHGLYCTGCEDFYLSADLVDG
ncbi:MAG: class I tRNA ligase family protein, partial [Gemmatimonadaceae bacterium]